MSDVVTFAALVAMPEADVIGLTSAGLLDSDGDGSYDDLDVLRAWAIRHHLRLGRSVDEIARRLADGSLETPFGDGLFDASHTPPTVEDVTAQTTFTADDVHQIRAALGLPSAVLLASDVDTLLTLETIHAAGLPLHAIVEYARVIGDCLRRVAETEARLVHDYVHRAWVADGLGNEASAMRAREFGETISPLVDPLLLLVHRRHLLQALVDDSLIRARPPNAPEAESGAFRITALFLDVVSFTALTDAEGDEVAADMLDRLDTEVRSLALTHHGRLAKQIGDAFLLVFRQPQDAVRFAIEINRITQHNESFPSLRIGLNEGSVMYRVGEYVGSAINLAARITTEASAGEIVCTKPIAKSIASAAIPNQRLGRRPIRGLEEPVELYRVALPQMVTKREDAPKRNRR